MCVCVCLCLCVCVCVKFGTEEREITDFKSWLSSSVAPPVSRSSLSMFLSTTCTCQWLLLSVSSLNVLDQTAFSFLYIYCFNFFNHLCVILIPIPESDSHYQSCLYLAWISCWCKSRILICTQVFKSLCFKQTFARHFTLFRCFVTVESRLLKENPSCMIRQCFQSSCIYLV